MRIRFGPAYEDISCDAPALSTRTDLSKFGARRRGAQVSMQGRQGLPPYHKFKVTAFMKLFSPHKASAYKQCMYYCFVSFSRVNAPTSSSPLCSRTPIAIVRAPPWLESAHSSCLPLPQPLPFPPPPPPSVWPSLRAGRVGLCFVKVDGQTCGGRCNT